MVLTGFGTSILDLEFYCGPDIDDPIIAEEAQDLLEHTFMLYTSATTTVARAQIGFAARLKGIKLLEREGRGRREGQLFVDDAAGDVEVESPLLVVTGIEGDEVRIRRLLPILEFLDERIPRRKPLLPPVSEPGARGKVRELVAILGGYVLGPSSRVGLKRMRDSEGTEDKNVVKKAMQEEFMEFEKAVRGFAGRCSIGDEVSMADVVLGPLVVEGMRRGVEFQDMPTIQRIFEAIGVMEEFREEMARQESQLHEKLALRRGRHSPFLDLVFCCVIRTVWETAYTF